MRKSILLTLFMIFAGSISFTSVAAQELVYVPVNPCRIVDTRSGGGAITANSFSNFRVSGTAGELASQGGTAACLDPKSETGLKPLAISAYVVAVPPGPGSGSGVLTAYPSNQPPPPKGSGSTVNFAAGQVIGNTTNITLCDTSGSCPTDGEFAILSRNANQHVVIDVQGYFYPLLIEGTCSANAPTRFVDNGDSTICDSQTGLMWEKKTVDRTGKLDDPRDVDNNYTWSSTSNTAPDGTAFTDFLARLNNTVASSAADVPFAGHTDWRLPTSAELRTIVDCSFGSPCIDPIFGPTAATWYWSSTSFDASTPSLAWEVSFDFVSASFGNKRDGSRVRAVRGGR